MGLRSVTVFQVQLTPEVTEYAVSLQNSWHHNGGCVVCYHCISVIIRSWTAVCERFIDFGISELSDSPSQSDLFLPLIVGEEVIVAVGDTHTFGRILWMRDWPNAGTVPAKHTALIRNRHPCHWQDSNPQSQRVATDPRCRLHLHRDWHVSSSCT
jgi:hypothetical protein